MRFDRRLTALLGPTNTGKTFFAIERMLGHASGVIGFPLRLLARENYERILKLKGAGQVALVTGEEKIIPPGARYFCCTVESMPLDRTVDFLAVDEIQLCGDPERGHIFTDRLLYARGESETIFLGSDTIRPILQRLVPDIEFISRPRFSTLTYTGRRKLTRLPPKTAVIAFSAAEVYEMAELLRRQRGGTAVVLGALSPRARNAQVALFEAGEVDYLVATDAIGMGLNLSLDHVAFARLSKFDGRYPRPLSPAEIGQIAGRAGRHMKDGTFGTTNEQPDLSLDLVEAVENHRFQALPYLYWRNPALDFSNPRSLLRSLEKRTPNPDLMRVRDAEDADALAVLSRDPDIDQRARGVAAVKLLWDVCQIPDFSKNLTDQHTRLLTQVYRYLIDDGGRLPIQWVAGQIQRLDRSDGDIDVLTTRLAQVRTWTYITHRGDWVENSGEWQDRARALEDRISDALHERLTERFVDRRAALFAKRLSGGEKLWGAIKSTGEVLVEGHAVGKLEAFRFQLDPAITGEDRPAALTAVRRSLGEEIPRRLAKLEDADDSAFQLDASGRITWQGAAVARLAAGDRPLAPRIEPLDSEFLDGLQRERLRRRLVLWLERYLGRRLEPLFRLAAAPLPATARGLAFQLVEALGCLPRAQALSALSTLGRAERKALTQLGVRIGRESLYLVGLFKAKSIALRALLWSVRHGAGDLVRPAPEVQATVLIGPAQPGFLSALGYLSFERKGRTVVIRADTLERLLDRLDRIGGDGAFQVTASLEHASGCDASTLSLLLPALGYRALEQDGKLCYRPPTRGARHRRQNRGFEKSASGNPDSPFAKLKDLGLKS